MNFDIVILGSGESGAGAALLAKKQHLSVFVSDMSVIEEKYKNVLIENNIPFEEGKHSEEIILSANEIIKSPGIPHKVSIIQKAIEKNIPIISEIEFAYRYKGDSKIIAITGSNGKTTTTSLLFSMFQQAGMDASMVGNIGWSFAKQVAEKPTAWYIMEISSFQLDDILSFRPDVAVITNITPDHLDRYQYQFENYIKAKFNITKFQTTEDNLVVCKDDEASMTFINNNKINSKFQYFSMKEQMHNGAYITENEIVFQSGDEKQRVAIGDLSLNGKHNIYNSMAAGISAKIATIRIEKIKECLTSFSALEHRMEHVLTIRGVDFINDSKATNLNSVWYALESMKKQTVLILGGVDKGNNYEEILDLVKEKVKAIVCLGADNLSIRKTFDGIVPILETASMIEAVNSSFELASKGDCVLLSPACASFDLFKNYEDRGLQFKQAVKQL
ncbi:MAG: UDP-N-acetylmuramoyl-L-alanine--D-glutamate ligase [Chitinophagaceae bacterium]|nr:UDP-N-acetylmuramoyl-L-alanine--D-glutamate ligase [Chitinophagaceae bacterium]